MSGHATIIVGEQVRNANGEAIGPVRTRSVSGNSDSAFATSSSTLSTTIIQNRQTLTASSTLAAPGTTFNLAGQVSGIRSGSVWRTGWSAAGLTNLSQATFAATYGDSGGPIYRLISGTRPVAGILVGESGGYRAFCLNAAILSTHGISMF